MNTLVRRPGAWAFLWFLSATGLAFGQDDKGGSDLEQEVQALKERVEALEEAAKRKGAEPEDWRIFWDRGLNFERSDGAFSLEISGKVHVDAGFMSGDREVDEHLEARGETLDDGVEFRRARITLAGRVYGRFMYKAAYDFAGGEAEFKDVYLGMDGLPLESEVRVGHFREPFSLEMVTPDEGLRFMERSSVQALAPSRNTGAGWLGTLLDERLSFGGGAFYNTDSFGNGGSDGDLSATARITGLPWYRGDDGLFHVGAAYSYRGEDELSFAARPEVFMAPEFIETRDIAVSGADLAGAESAVVLDAFSAQGEYVLVDMNPRDGGDVDARGYYVAGAYSLTGEHRAYDRAYGRFGRITPDSPFLSEEGGPGAWEIAARYSLLDLDDERIPRGGEMADYTLGVNWHLNDAVCVMSTYVHSHLDDIGSARFFAIRFGIVF